MPKGSTPRFTRMVMGLLVLVGLLLSGVQDPAAEALHHAGHHHDLPLVQTVDDAAHQAVATPSDDHDDHGLPCCLACECAMHAAVFPTSATTFLTRHAFGMNYLPGPNSDWPGIATMPASPPPRRVA